jgi:hypothetical protein
LQSFGQHQAFLPQEWVPDKLKFLFQNYFYFETIKSIFEKDVKKNFQVNFGLDKPATYYNFVKDPFKSHKNMREGIYYLRP